MSSKPSQYHTITPYLYVKDAAAAIAFYEAAFGAKELMRLGMPGSKTIMHAELQIAESVFMLADEMPDWGNRGPHTLGGTTFVLMVYVEDVDAAFAQAIATGATVHRPVETMFYGDRCGSLYDPFGHQWMLTTHVEDVSPEDMHTRFTAMMANMSGPA